MLLLFLHIACTNPVDEATIHCDIIPGDEYCDEIQLCCQPDLICWYEYNNTVYMCTIKYPDCSMTDRYREVVRDACDCSL